MNAHCSFPTRGVVETLLRAEFPPDDSGRITVETTACGDGSYPFLASVRVDGREVYRILSEPDEVFAADVLADLAAALRRAV